MAEYRVTGPDGSTYNVTGPDGATDQQVLAQVKAYKPAGQAQTGVGAQAPAKPATSATAAPGKPDKPDWLDTTDFVTGNLNLGIADMAGMPIDTLTNALNLGIAGVGSATGTTPSLIEKPFGGSQSIEGLMRRTGMVTQSADPQSGAGRYAAAAIRMLPSAAMGRPNLRQAPKALGAAATSGLGAQAASDIGGPEYGPVGAMLPSAFQLAKPPSAGQRAASDRQTQRFVESKELGIPIPPRDMKPDKPQQSIVDAALRDLRLPASADITDPKMRRNYKNAYWQDYEAVMAAPELKGGVVPNETFQQAIKSIGDEISAGKKSLPKTFEGAGPVVELLKEYGYTGTAKQPTYAHGLTIKGIPPAPTMAPIPPKVAMNAIRQLREDAATNFSSDKASQHALGKTQRQIADALENLVGEQIKDPATMERFRTARTQIAKMHDIEASLDPATGKIVPAKLAAMRTEGAPLTGEIEKVAKVAGEFPRSVRTPQTNDELFTKRVTPMAVMHPGAMGAHWATRLFDPITMSRPYQSMIVDPRTRLSPEAMRALRFMAAGQAANRRPEDEDQIPIPPRQEGGPVGAGQSYLVGERGPELFVPQQNGKIIANKKKAQNRKDDAGAIRSGSSFMGVRG